MDYCKVDAKGKILDGPRSLPRSTERVSGFNLLPAEKVREFGWVPFVEPEGPQLREDEKLLYGPLVFDPMEDVVTRTVSSAAVPAEELAKQDTERSKHELERLLEQELPLPLIRLAVLGLLPAKTLDEVKAKLAGYDVSVLLKE